MRETIGSTWIMQLMFGFILLFVSFLAITISYSKSFRIKNELTSIIEKYGGYNSTSSKIIGDYVRGLGYYNRGRCPERSLGVSDLSTGKPVEVSGSGLYYYCIKKEVVGNKSISNIYYEVTTFYKFNLPIVGDITTFSVKGKTTDLTDYRGTDCFESSC